MKHTRVSLLALSALAGGVFIASAADVGTKYNLNAEFTNNPPHLTDIGDLPKLPANAGLLDVGGMGVIATDGGGKISGVQRINSNIGGGTNAYLIADVTGSLSGKGVTNGDVIVKMNIKGNGYAESASGTQTTAKVSLSFKGTTGITPNVQVINNNLPGWNIYLDSDGTTNSMTHYDPWHATNGIAQTYRTYTIRVDDFYQDTLYTTNMADTNAVVYQTNLISASIQNENDVYGYFYKTNLGYTQYLGWQDIRFAVPVTGGDYSSDPVGYIELPYWPYPLIPMWVVAEEVSLRSQTNAGVGTNVLASILSTNFTYGSGDYLPDGNYIFGVSTNVAIATNATYLTITPSGTNVLITTNSYFVFRWVENTSTNPIFGVNFSCHVYDTNNSHIGDQYFLNQEHVGYGFDTTNTAGDLLYSNVFVVYTPAVLVTTNFVVEDYPYTNLLDSAVVYDNQNVTNQNQIIITNWSVVVDDVLYGAALGDLVTALVNYNNNYNTTNTDWYDGSFDDQWYSYAMDEYFYLWANQFVTNYSVNLIVATNEVVHAPTFTNYMTDNRVSSNYWRTISGVVNGTITAGKVKKTLKNAAGLFEEDHQLWTAAPSDAGEANYYIQYIYGNLETWNNDELDASVVQYGKKIYTSGYGFKGTGSLDGKGNYKADLKGIAWDKGSSYKLNGTTRSVITGYDVITNAPPAVQNVTNFAVAPPYVVSLTNTTSGYLEFNWTIETNYVNGNTTTFAWYTFGDLRVTNYVYKTNYAADAIGSVTLNGKVMGQKLVKDATIGRNLDEVLYIEEVPVPYVPTIYTNYVGWPISRPWPY
jgi:hypothetical protein